MAVPPRLGLASASYATQSATPDETTAKPVTGASTAIPAATMVARSPAIARWNACNRVQEYGQRRWPIFRGQCDASFAGRFRNACDDACICVLPVSAPVRSNGLGLAQGAVPAR